MQACTLSSCVWSACPFLFPNHHLLPSYVRHPSCLHRFCSGDSYRTCNSAMPPSSVGPTWGKRLSICLRGGWGDVSAVAAAANGKNKLKCSLLLEELHEPVKWEGDCCHRYRGAGTVLERRTRGVSTDLAKTLFGNCLHRQSINSTNSTFSRYQRVSGRCR